MTTRKLPAPVGGPVRCRGVAAQAEGSKARRVRRGSMPPEIGSRAALAKSSPRACAARSGRSSASATAMTATSYHPASMALRRVAAQAEAGQATTIGMLLDGLGSAGVPLAVVLLALPSLLPIPVLPTGPVAGTLLILIGVEFGLGARRLRLPGVLLRIGLPRNALAAVFRRALPLVERVERWLRPGRVRWLTGAAARPLLGASIGLLGLALIPPVPFGNQPPGIALILLGLGLLARDGLAVLVALCLGLLALAWVLAISAGTVYALHLAAVALGWW